MKITFWKIIGYLVPVFNNKITLIYFGYSGSNLTPIIKYFESKEHDYQIKIINNFDDESFKGMSKYKVYSKKIIRRICNYFNLVTSKLIITTHGYKRLNNKTIMLNLWHGFPIKSMGLMRNGRLDKTGFIDDDYFISTSPMFNTVMNSCMGIYGDKYKILGYPRNDYLYKSSGINKLKELVDIQDDSKIIFFMPTYESTLINNNDFFGIPNFDIPSFQSFLSENKLEIIMKLHPSEENNVLSIMKGETLNKIHILESDKLNKEKIDLYEVMNAADILLTDYSSIYFDFLLLNRPIIFVSTYLDFYRKDRGLLLEPYEFWTPGPKVNTQEDFHREILEYISNENYYESERKMITKLIHDHQDSKSTHRIIDLISSIMKLEK